MDNEWLKDWEAMRTTWALHRQNLRWKAQLVDKGVASYLCDVANLLTSARVVLDQAILEASAKEN